MLAVPILARNEQTARGADEDTTMTKRRPKAADVERWVADAAREWRPSTVGERVIMSTDRNERVCHVCGFRCREWCPVCIAAFPSRRSAAEMSVEERVAEMAALSGPLEIPFAMVHERIEELVGRPVYTFGLEGHGTGQA